MKVTLEGEFLNARPTKTGKGHMVSILQSDASCELYAPNDAGLQFPDRMTPVKVTALIRTGYEGRGFNATIQSIEKVGAPAPAGAK